MSVKRVGPVVLFSLLLIFSFVQTKGQDLTFEDGFEDGLRAAREDANEIGTYFTTFYLDPTPPPSTMEKIVNKPQEYRNGFLKGYKVSFRKASQTSPAMYIFVAATVGGIVLAAGLAVSLVR